MSGPIRLRQCFCRDVEVVIVKPECGDTSQCLGCNSLSALDAKIAETRAQLKTLVEQREQTYTCLNSCHDRLLGRLPPEICSRIFMFSRERPPDRENRNCGRPITSFRLSLVCKAWRNIAYSTPQLWTTLVLKLRLETEIKPVMGIFSTLLARSGSLPLHLSMSTQDHKDLNSPIAYLLRITSNRLKELHITPNLLPLLLTSQCTSLFRLIIDGYHQKEEFPIVPRDSLDSLPKPFYLEVNVRSSLVPINRIPILWNSLIEFKCATLDLPNCLAVIRHSPSLKHLQIQRLKAADDDLNMEAQVTHSNLETMCLSIGECRGDLQHFFAKISLPSLAKLELNGQNFDSPEAGPMPSGLKEFFQRSAPSISSLILNKCTPIDIPLTDLLALLPSLQEFEVVSAGARFVTPFLERFRETSASLAEPGTSFLPNLKKLKVEVFGSSYGGRKQKLNLDDSELLCMFPPEGTSVTFQYRPLRELEICHRTFNSVLSPGSPVIRPSKETVDRLKERGFNVNIAIW